jgi:uncharacterized membrane-anchored protein
MGWIFTRWLVRAITLAMVFGAFLPHGFAQQQSQSAEDQVKSLHWIRSGTLDLAASSSKVSLPVGFVGIEGQDARTFEKLTQAHVNDETEGFLVNKNDDEVVFQYFKSGFVTIDDWKDLDPKALIQEIRDNTEADNQSRRDKGMPELHVTGWLQEPSFDRATKTVFWAINARSSDGSGVVNSIALRLGRGGYEKVIWIVDPTNFRATGGVLDAMLRAHSFDPGQRYEDHAEGDKLAGYGIAALVGAVAGAKLAKIGAFAVILLFVKKIWFLGFAAIAIFFKKIKSLFRSRPNPPLPPSNMSA